MSDVIPIGKLRVLWMLWVVAVIVLPLVYSLLKLAPPAAILDFKALENIGHGWSVLALARIANAGLCVLLHSSVSGLIGIQMGQGEIYRALNWAVSLLIAGWLLISGILVVSDPAFWVDIL